MYYDSSMHWDCSLFFVVCNQGEKPVLKHWKQWKKATKENKNDMHVHVHVAHETFSAWLNHSVIHFCPCCLLPMMFLGLHKLGNICCSHKMFLNKLGNIFCVPDTKFVSATNVARAGKWENICFGNSCSDRVRPRKTSTRVHSQM